MNILPKVFIVHYSKLRYRRKSLEKKLKEFGFDYEFIVRYDREDLTKDLLKSAYLDDKEEYEARTRGLWSGPSARYRKLSLAEISCTLKHFEAIRLASLEYGPSLILEDDSILFENFKENLEKVISESLNLKWDSIFLGLGCGRDFQNYILKNRSKKMSESLFQIEHPATNCAEAYLVTKDCAHRISKNCFPFFMISDWELAYLFDKNDMNIFWSIPSLCWQGSKNGKFESTLDYGQR